MSSLHVLLIFVGLPLLVIAAIYLLAYAPTWMRGPRFRPGQSWAGASEWFGVTPAGQGGVAATGSARRVDVDVDGGHIGGATAVPVPAGEPTAGAAGGSPAAGDSAAGNHGAGAHAASVPDPGLGPTPTSGGASAGW